METNEIQHLFEIQEGLEKHFDSVYADSWSDDEIITFECRIDCGLTDDVWLRFPFYTDAVFKANPYDVVNAIWEYIVDYML